LRFQPEAASVPAVTRILIIEDDLAIQDLLRDVLRDGGYQLLFVHDLDHAAANVAPDVVITDLVDIDAYDSGRARESVHRVQQRYPGTPIVVCTAHADALEESDRLGAAAVLRKTFSIDALFDTVARLSAR